MGKNDTPLAYISGVKDPIAISSLKKPVTEAQVQKMQQKVQKEVEKKEAQAEYLKDVESYRKLKDNLDKDIGKVKADKVLNKVIEQTSNILDGKTKIDHLYYLIYDEAYFFQ